VIAGNAASKVIPKSRNMAISNGRKNGNQPQVKYRAGCTIITVPAILYFDNNITAAGIAGTATLCMKICLVLIQSRNGFMREIITI
jgi:hypothetical protein